MGVFEEWGRGLLRWSDVVGELRHDGLTVGEKKGFTPTAVFDML